MYNKITVSIYCTIYFMLTLFIKEYFYLKIV